MIRTPTGIDPGAQLYLFRDVLDETDMERVLAQLSEGGYSYVETMYGRAPQQRALLDRLNLRCYATHVALSALPEESALTEFAHRLGAEVICISGLLRWEERSADDYRRAADALNALGHNLQRSGLSLHYHNHEFEFERVDGETTGMDLLLAGLDPEAVSLCFDAGWSALAGCDPVAFLRAHAARIGTMHLRDFRGGVSVPLGAGDIDQSPIVHALADLPHLRAVLVEQDPGAENPIEDMLASRRFLRGIA